MRWFKHLTCSHDDEKLCLLADRLGMKGYGSWWILLERIAQQVTEDKEPKLRISLRSCADVLRMYVSCCRDVLSVLNELNLIHCEYIDDKTVQLSVPNLIKYRDEYTDKKMRRKAKSPDTVGTQSGANRASETETETETETDKEIPPYVPPEGGQCEAGKNGKEKKPSKPRGPKLVYSAQVEEIYAAYPRKEGKGKACEKIEIALRTVPFEELLQATREYANCRYVRSAPILKIPHPATWYFQQRWLDDREGWNRAYGEEPPKKTQAPPAEVSYHDLAPEEKRKRQVDAMRPYADQWRKEGLSMETIVKRLQVCKLTEAEIKEIIK
jgi:hypothetical protein